MDSAYLPSTNLNWLLTYASFTEGREVIGTEAI